MRKRVNFRGKSPAKSGGEKKSHFRDAKDRGKDTLHCFYEEGKGGRDTTEYTGRKGGRGAGKESS